MFQAKNWINKVLDTLPTTPKPIPTTEATTQSSGHFLKAYQLFTTLAILIKFLF